MPNNLTGAQFVDGPYKVFVTAMSTARAKSLLNEMLPGKSFTAVERTTFNEFLSGHNKQFKQIPSVLIIDTTDNTLIHVIY